MLELCTPVYERLLNALGKNTEFLSAFGKNRKKEVSKTREILTDGCMGGGGGQGKKKLFLISFKNSEKTEIK